MCLLELELLIYLRDERSAGEVYAAFTPNTVGAIRKAIKRLITKGLLKISRRVKMVDGPGRPMNFYLRTKKGGQEAHKRTKRLIQLGERKDGT